MLTTSLHWPAGKSRLLALGWAGSNGFVAAFMFYWALFQHGGNGIERRMVNHFDLLLIILTLFWVWAAPTCAV
jgi:hypothetical protein